MSIPRLRVGGLVLVARTPVRCALTVLVSLCLFGGVVLGGAPARAAILRTELAPLTEVPVSSGVPVTGPLQKQVPDLAVDGKEDLFLVSSGVVDEFDSSGVFLAQIGNGVLNEPGSLAVDNATGEVYVADVVSGSPVVDVFSAAGGLLGVWNGSDTPSGSFSGHIVLAIDNSTSLSDPAAGDAYVLDAGHHVIDVFKPEAGGKEKYATQLTAADGPAGAIGEAYQMGVDEATGDVLVASPTIEEGHNNLHFFAPTPVGGYEYIRTVNIISGINIAAIVAERSSGNIFVMGGVIDEYTPTGGFIEAVHGSWEGVFESRLPRTMAVSGNGQLYVPDFYTLIRRAPPVTIPDVVAGSASDLQLHSVTLNGTVNTDSAGSAECRFEYGATKAYGQSVPCSPQTVPSGSAPIAVSAEATGLQSDEAYHFRVVATNANGSNSSNDMVFRTAGVALTETAVSDVSASSVTFRARVDPNTATTYYYFEYGTTVSYGADAPALPGAAIAVAEGVQNVSLHVQGLSPGTSYHYRAVASSEYVPGKHVTVESLDQTFTSQAVVGKPSLPDARQYEEVSPVEKDGAQIFGIQYDRNFNTIGGSGATQAAEDGTGLTYLASSATGENQSGNTYATQLLSRRGANGWSTQDISPPDPNPVGLNIEKGEAYRLFSSNLSRGVLFQPEEDSEPSLSSEASGEFPNWSEIYLRENGTGVYRALIKEPLKHFEEIGNGGEPEFLEGSSDLSHVVFVSKAHLLPQATGFSSLYEWYGGELHLVSVLPNKETYSVLPFLGGKSASGEVSEFIGRHAVSSDGTRVVWGDLNNKLFSRDMATEETVRVDEPQGGSESGESAFQLASSDGTRVFFTNTGTLTKDASGGGLYMFNVADGKLTDLTPGSSGAEVLGSSEDGTMVYVDTGSVLTSAPNGAGAKASEGATNTYLLRETPVGSGSWTPTFITSGVYFAPLYIGQRLAELTVRVSPNGQYFAFMSNASLTGYDNRDANTGIPDEEIYEYSTQTNSLVCASCNRTGAKPVGSATIPGWNENRYAWTNQVAPSLYQSRILSDSGRLFFDDADALVSADVNGRQDVYEYEPTGAGSCTGIPGCIALISAGAGNNDSVFVDASANGNDVFFITNDKLVAQDKDTAVDMYDAHVCSSSEPCAPPSAASPPPCVTTDGCRGAPAQQPGVFGSPASAKFNGAGNITSSGPASVVKAKSLTRAQQLSRALHACRKHGKRKRSACEAAAKKRYGMKTKTNAKKSARRSK